MISNNRIKSATVWLSAILTLLPWVGGGVLLTSCTEVDPYGEGIANKFQLSVSPSTVTLDDMGRASVEVSAYSSLSWSCDNVWSLSDFFELSNSSGTGSQTITIEATDDSDSKSEQRKTVELSSNRYNRRASFDVVIPGTYVQCTPSAPSFTEYGGEVTLIVKSNASWYLTMYDYPSWLSVYPTSGGRGTTSVTLTATANQTINPNSGTIDFSTAAGYFFFDVSQAGAEARLSLSPDVLNLPYTASSSNRVNLLTNVGSYNYTIGSPNYNQDASEGWVSTSTWSDYFYVSTKANDHLYSRKATITVYAAGKSATLTINQAAAPERLSVSPAEDAVFTSTGYRSGSTTYKYKDYTIDTNASSWYVYSYPSSWVNYEERSGNVLRISVKGDNTSTTRDNEGDIVIKSANKTATIHVKQLRKTSTDINLDDFGNDKSLD